MSAFARRLFFSAIVRRYKFSFGQMCGCTLRGFVCTRSAPQSLLHATWAHTRIVTRLPLDAQKIAPTRMLRFFFYVWRGRRRVCEFSCSAIGPAGRRRTRRRCTQNHSTFVSGRAREKNRVYTLFDIFFLRASRTWRFCELLRATQLVPQITAVHSRHADKNRHNPPLHAQKRASFWQT